MKLSIFNSQLSKLIIVLAVCALTLPAAYAEHLVIIAANDTHSQIEPAADGKGGVARRRAIYDKIRSENPNTLTIHAGDAVQGTVFFSLYGGEVEYALMDTLGYDIIVIGNHEFDNGLDSVAYYYKDVKAKKLSANYDFSGTSLDGMFEPYVIKRVGDKRVGFFGINVTPTGLIADANCKGMRYLPADEVADATAKYLKEVQKVDYAVMVSHIGYTAYNPVDPCDTMVIAHSRYIDFVIGGHSHTVIKPGSGMEYIRNADGKPILVGQNGKSGKIVATYDLDLETGEVRYDHISVDASWDEAAKAYPAMDAWLAGYREGVDSLMNNPIGHSARYMKNSSYAAQNWLCDAVMAILPGISGMKKIDCVIMNKGGIRTDMPQGVITEGVMLSMFPFDNRFCVVELTGQDLIDALTVMAGRDGDATSKELTAAYDANGHIVWAKVKGKKINPKKKYVVGTIDYLQKGGDYMTPLGRGRLLWSDTGKYGDHMINYIRALEAKGKLVDADDTPRMTKVN